MERIYTIDGVRKASLAAKTKGQRVAFVSTMGALHKGHLSLVTLARDHADVVIASVFLNPTHFAEGEDYDRYPRQADEDCRLLEGAGCDIAWIPPVEDIYPFGVGEHVRVHFDRLGAYLCGKTRPHFFEGVTTIVLKEFIAVVPDVALFGEKDFQQLVVCRGLVKDLSLPIEIVAGPTIREDDGLAFSSRNTYLTAEERARAPALFQSLQLVKQGLIPQTANFADLANAARQKIGSAGMTVDYFELVHPETLDPATESDPVVVAAGAAFLGATRLIDNVTIDRSL